jgi:hypothetical protein
MAIGRGGFRCFESAFERLCFVSHNRQKEVEGQLTTGLSAFDICKAALIATASRTPGRISRYAGLKRNTALFFRIVYSAKHEISLTQFKWGGGALPWVIRDTQ